VAAPPRSRRSAALAAAQLEDPQAGVPVPRAVWLAALAAHDQRVAATLPPLAPPPSAAATGAATVTAPQVLASGHGLSLVAPRAGPAVEVFGARPPAPGAAVARERAAVSALLGVRFRPARGSSSSSSGGGGDSGGAWVEVATEADLERQAAAAGGEWDPREAYAPEPDLGDLTSAAALAASPLAASTPFEYRAGAVLRALFAHNCRAMWACDTEGFIEDYNSATESSGDELSGDDSSDAEAALDLELEFGSRAAAAAAAAAAANKAATAKPRSRSRSGSSRNRSGSSRSRSRGQRTSTAAAAAAAAADGEEGKKSGSRSRKPSDGAAAGGSKTRSSQSRRR
jgi:uncharacterized membrane protein YgcG